MEKFGSFYQVKHSFTTGSKISLQVLSKESAYISTKTCMGMFKTGRWKQTSINRWMDKLRYIQQWNTTAQQKGWTIDIHRNMDGYQKHNAELKKPYTGYIPYDSIYMKLYRRQNWSAVKSDHWMSGVGQRETTAMGRGRFGEGDRNILHIDCRGDYTDVDTCQNSLITHLKWVHLVWIFHRCVLLL